MLALDGISVLDLTWQGPGPFCTWIMGDLGATIIKVGAPPKTGIRQAVPETKSNDVAYRAINRNKKSILLNLASEEGRNIFHRLAEKADVIVEGFRPGVVKRLGVDYEIIKEINPRIIYCSISGYGQDGPYRDLPGHDINCISMAGALNLIGNSNGAPVIPLNLLADYGAGGMNSVIGILAALIARGKTGKGQFIDISLTDSTISLLTETVLDYYFQYGSEIKRGELAHNGGYPYYNTYETKDGKFITLGCLEPWLWENLCRQIGKEEFIPFHFEEEHLIHPPRDEKWQDILSCLKQLFLTRTRDEWFELLGRNNIPVGKVYSLDEVFTDPQVLHRKMIVELEHPTGDKIKQVGIAIKLSDTPGEVRSLPPVPGQHTEEILASLGYARQKTEKLRRDGIIN